MLTKTQESQIVDNVRKHYNGEQVTYTDTVIKKWIWKKERKREVYKKIEEFSASKLVVTDRLHGMVFAALAGTPCIALGNCNYKVKGIYNWIKDNQYIAFIEDFDILEQKIYEMSQIMEEQHLDKVLIDSAFEELKAHILA